MLFKMLGIERAWVMHSGEDIPKPRQLFVTQSRVLAGKVEEYFLKLLDSLATASLTPRETIFLSGLANWRIDISLSSSPLTRWVLGFSWIV